MFGMKKVVRLGVAGALLAPALALGLAQPASAGTISKNGCTLTPLTPSDSHSVSGDFAKRIDYRIRVTCGPGRTVDVRQIVREDDQSPDPDDFVGLRTLGRSFTQPAGAVTRYLTSRLPLPDTEAGSEDVYHAISFRVRSNTPGGFVGTWSGWTSSPTAVIAN